MLLFLFILVENQPLFGGKLHNFVHCFLKACLGTFLSAELSLYLQMTKLLSVVATTPKIGVSNASILTEIDVFSFSIRNCNLKITKLGFMQEVEGVPTVSNLL